MEITKSDFEAWWNSPVGVEFRKLLDENLEKIAHGSMNMDYAFNHTDKAIEIGKYYATSFYKNLTYEALTGKTE